ncbi:unnamed protein product (macronuclear) [Paramecium tetraurelia]|uniref:Uncharacterized protein n=1 Tax=Paramecium tetraurelia TaxID=5888 RepID=A0CRM6_PARTE|nr:uncharacterized protein GSPATT00009758001 [Paramecium tetraurelia]CAK73443.1 unnamed protein product [Paramecium tetraurelia]|eukprot:XP_001440840.1 hypothetical protein (macronuclear) [Paramecium tetraurelia strain d4-2]
MGDIDIKDDEKTLSLQNQNLTQIAVNHSKQPIQCIKQYNQINEWNIYFSQFKSFKFIQQSNQKDIWLSKFNIIVCFDFKQQFQIQLIQGLIKCLELNTLILSNNQIITVQGISHLIKLEKLQLSHNQIELIKEPNIIGFTQLVNNNKLQEISAFFSQLTKLKRLEIGKNEIKDPLQILVLSDLKLIHQMLQVILVQKSLFQLQLNFQELDSSIIQQLGSFGITQIKNSLKNHRKN